MYSVTQAFFRYRLLASLLEHGERSRTIGEMFRQREEETGKLTYLERLWRYLAAFLKTVLNTLAHFLRSRTPVSSVSRRDHQYFQPVLTTSGVRHLSY